MAYKVGEPIRVIYQAGKGATGLTVNMTVYDEVGALDASMTAVMTPIGSTGRYSAQFTPDAEGLWLVHVDDNVGGKAVSSYAVGSTNVSEIGATVTTINAKVDAISEQLGSFPMIA